MTASPTTVFVFLISYGRSGSSLVHEVLARHPDVGFVSNLEDRFPRLPPTAGRYNNVFYRRVPQTFTRKGRPRYAPSEAYRLLAREVSPMVADSSRDLFASDAMPGVAKRFQTFFTDRAAAQRQPVFIHKFTGWPRSGFVRSVFPDARFIHIVRDPRDVAASDLRTSWWNGWLGPQGLGLGSLPPSYEAEWQASGQSFPLLAALVWKIVMDAFAAARQLVPSEQWLDMRFEDILANPQAHFKEMIDFAGLPQDKAFDAALSQTVFQADRQGVHQRDLDASSIATLQDSLAGHLRYWGYVQSAPA